LDVLERVAIAALRQAHEDDHRLNAVLETIRQEIKSPLFDQQIGLKPSRELRITAFFEISVGVLGLPPSRERHAN
jgi:hypothetical protein